MEQYVPPQGVYFLYNNRQLVYVGQTNDILRRISEHSKSKRFDDWRYVECDNETTREALECLLIYMLKPKYNVNQPHAYMVRKSKDVLIQAKAKTKVSDLIEFTLKGGVA